MKLVEINFSVPTPPPGSKELHWTRCIRSGKCKHQGTGEDLEYEIKVDVEERIVTVVELNSGERAFYPFEGISRMRPENES
jgi:hypothetical protein